MEKVDGQESDGVENDIHLDLDKEDGNAVPLVDQDASYRCLECDKTFDPENIILLEMHMKRVHAARRFYKCEPCRIGIVSRGEKASTRQIQEAPPAAEEAARSWGCFHQCSALSIPLQQSL